MTTLIYLIKEIFICGLLLGYYWLFLRNRFFHGFNRLFLISIPILSFLLPALHFNLPAFWNHSTPGSPIRLLGVGQGGLEEAVTVYATKNAGNIFSWEYICLLLALTICSFLLIRFFRTIRFLQNLPKGKRSLKLPEANVYFVSEKGTPFSFFKSIFWGEEMDMNSKPGKQILRHELFHVKNNHSLDILLMEIFSILFWFNPFIHLIRRELLAIHEYAADAFAAEETNEYEYAGLLIMKISGSPLPLTNPFFNNQIKRRIAMITRTNKNKKALLGRFMILPLIALLICLFSFKMNTHLPFIAAKTIKVVVDPGHGGVFTGAQSNGIYEKNINLSIAKKIQSLAKEYNVEVIMTREKDEEIAGNDLKASLDYRVALAEKQNADVFVSIHTNSVTDNAPQDKYSGFDIYVPQKDSKFYAGSVKLASSIADYIKPDYGIASELKQGENRIRVLDHATVPAILIECGYMDNKTDLAWLLDEKNQEKIARDILEGIKKYSLQENSYKTAPNTSTDLTVEKDLNVSVMNSSKKDLNLSVKNSSEINNSLEVNENAKDSSAPLRKVEVEASYPGGEEGWKKYLMKTLTYPEEAQNKEVQGQVIVEFVVNEDGSLTNVHAISGPKTLRAESVRVVRESGNWIPAMDKGAKVACYTKQPINYKLSVQ